MYMFCNVNIPPSIVIVPAVLETQPSMLASLPEVLEPRITIIVPSKMTSYAIIQTDARLPQKRHDCFAYILPVRVITILLGIIHVDAKTNTTESLQWIATCLHTISQSDTRQ